MPSTCPNLCGKNPDCQNEISCFKKIAGILTGDEILEHKIVLTEQGKKMTEADEDIKLLKATTFDLTVGDGHYLYNGLSDGNKKWTLIYIGDANEDELNKNYPVAEKYKRPDGDQPKTLSIPPFGSALIQLQQVINTYDIACEKDILVVGRFDLKLSRVHEGLISQQATQVEPCYKGKLFCFVHNLTNRRVELHYGHPIATIEFSYVSCFCDMNRRKNIIGNIIKANKQKYNTEYCNKDCGIKDIRYFYHREELPNDCGLLSFKSDFKEIMFSDDNLDDLAKRVKKRMVKIPYWIKLACTIIGVVGSIFIAYMKLNSNLDDIKTKHSEINKMYEEIKEKYNELPDNTSNEINNNINIENKNEENQP